MKGSTIENIFKHKGKKTKTVLDSLILSISHSIFWFQYTCGYWQVLSIGNNGTEGYQAGVMKGSRTIEWKLK